MVSVAEFVCGDEIDVLIGVFEIKVELSPEELIVNAEVKLPVEVMLKSLVLDKS